MKLLYFCHIDWSWIKQRPQFLAEELEVYCHVHILYPWSNRRGNMVKDASRPKHYTKLYSLPSLGRIKEKYFRRFNDELRRIQIYRTFKRVKPDIVWIPHPEYFKFIPEFYRRHIVYDCMDDYCCIEPDLLKQEVLINQEVALIRCAQCVFISSQHLADKLMQRVPELANKWVLLRNGYLEQWKRRESTQGIKGESLHIGYFGTIGRWFDWDTLWQTLNVNKKIIYDLYGPVEREAKVMKHERIHYHGIVTHDQIPADAENVDALIMPFKRCDIVDSVDPVKLYEYICLGKPIFCVKYTEIERFERFVHFYTSPEELNGMIRCLDVNHMSSCTKEEVERFLSENTWACRGKKAWEQLKKLQEQNRREEIEQ